jgi:hypothetical protein
MRMSTALEIEAALEHLPQAERSKLRARLLERVAAPPKSGAELAALWRASFHLTKQEADDFAQDLAPGPQPPSKAPEWE